MSASPRQDSRLSDMPARVLTAVVYGGIVLGAIIFGRTLGLAVVVAILAAFAVTEFYALTRRKRRMPNEVFGILATVAMPLASALWGRLGLLSALTALLFAALVWHVIFRQVRTADTATTLFGAVYVGFALSHLVLIRSLDGGTELALAAVISVWVNDVLAYLVGSKIGTRKMTPVISPNKTWEGFAAGAAGTLGIWLCVTYVADLGITLSWSLTLGVAVVLAAVLGDLFESRLKREADVKDSGSLLPGHGGFLDRLDSLILVSVVAYYLLVAGGLR